MSVIVTGVLLMVGAVIVGKTYSAIDQTGLPASSTASLDGIMTNSATAFDFLGLGLIVAGAMSIVGAVMVLNRQ